MSVLRDPPASVMTLCPMDARRLLPVPYLGVLGRGASLDEDDDDVFHAPLEITPEYAEELLMKQDLISPSFMDRWVECVPEFSTTVQRIRCHDVYELHASVQDVKRGRTPTCVVVKDEELGGYMRSISLEYPEWPVTIVISDTDPGIAPIESEKNEFKFSNGRWFVRRAERLHLDPL
eukprot:2779194-Rhodomonas_salina.1